MVSYGFLNVRLGQVHFLAAAFIFSVEACSTFFFFFFAGWLIVILASPLLTPPQYKGSIQTNKMVEFFSHFWVWMCSSLSRHTSQSDSDMTVSPSFI